MPPKKTKTTMSLNAFLGDSTLGSWADEMEAIPTAPAARSDDDRSRLGDRRRDDFLSSRPDRANLPPREDLPLPTEPPFTAFVGNLAFDLSELDLEEFFGSDKTKTVKIIRDRDDKPKGFGYVEFQNLDALKEALTRTGQDVSSGLASQIHASIPQSILLSILHFPTAKERPGFGGASEDDSKFAGNWRRDGPLPDLPSSRDGSRRRFDSHPPRDREAPPSSLSDNASDWRSSRPPATRSPPPGEDQSSSYRRRTSGFKPHDTPPSGLADTEDNWTMGSKFKPTDPGSPGSRFSSIRGRSDMGPPKDTPSPPDDDNWRRPGRVSRNSTSPSNSTPPTPQMSRRKLELLPRSGAPSAVPSPLSSPNPSSSSASRSNPFGAAKPVDVSAREAEVSERLEKDREATKERVLFTMSRTSSRSASHRGVSRGATPAVSPSSPKPESHKILHPSASANVRPSFSFASAAAGKKDAVESVKEASDETQEVADKLTEIQV
ncbi:hypothetical protein NLI96_g9690 [Meripilus lineatus]|uniref:RRM domain-containing protein n=1 Tax=Meripilus lineatus TaxID=2056292 RepID=A0AAD5UV53_9APHY|nr:hypothetical protein NLI96_g9690 [Physisporinus lineatus]